MNIIDKIKHTQKERLRKKVAPIVEELIKGVAPHKIVNYQKAARFVYQLAENKVWYMGKKELLQQFYKNPAMFGVTPDAATSAYNCNEFWRVIPNGGVKVAGHFPLASMISETMSQLLFNQMPELSIDTGKEKESELLTEVLNDILDDNAFEVLCQTGAQLESYSGTIAAKINMDVSVSDCPAIEIYPGEDIELISKNKRVIEVVFCDKLTYGNNEYTLKSHYGYGYIIYRLTNHNGKEVKLDTVPETAELKNIYFVDSAGNPLPVLMAAYKINRAVNNEFAYTCYGESDYSGLIDVFHDLDESWSSKTWTIRAGNPKLFVSEDMCIRDPRTGNALPPKSYDTDTVVLNDNKPDQKQGVMSRDIPDYNLQKFIDDNRFTINIALSKVGLSAQTIFEGQAGANASADALMVREGRTVKTRQLKIKLWEGFLKRLARLLLIYQTLPKAPAQAGTEITYTVENDFDYEYIVEFPPYEEETEEDRLPFAKEAFSEGLYERWEAIKYLRPKLTEEEAKQKAANIEGVIEPEPEEPQQDNEED